MWMAPCRSGLCCQCFRDFAGIRYVQKLMRVKIFNTFTSTFFENWHALCTRLFLLLFQVLPLFFVCLLFSWFYLKERYNCFSFHSWRGMRINVMKQYVIWVYLVLVRENGTGWRHYIWGWPSRHAEQTSVLAADLSLLECYAMSVGVISQKARIFSITTVRTSDLMKFMWCMVK